MEKMRMETQDLTAANVEKIGALFPNCITETKDENGKLKKAINFDLLRQMLSGDVVEGDEAYEFTWVGKKAAIVEANKPIRKTLRPCPEESVNWDSTENLYIEGDNLDVLKLLQESYLGKVKVIYIDPPYNTGSGLIYRNNFFQQDEDYLEDIGMFDEEHNRLFVNTKSNGRFHSDWCSMIFSRLLVARNLFAENGIIVLTIDDSEIENITSIMNEVFGEENHLATVVIKNNPSGRSTVKGFSINHEYALFYSKSNAAELGRMRHSDEQKARYKEKDTKGYFEWENFRKNGTDSNRADRPKQFFPIIINTFEDKLRIPEVDWDDKTKQYMILDDIGSSEIVLYPKTPDGIEKVWKYGIERSRAIISEILVKKTKDGYELYRKKYLNNEGSLPRTWWDKPDYSARDNGTRTLTNIFGPVKIFDFPKAPEAVKDALIAANLQDGDLVLDFFSGSATTADAILHLNAEDGGKRKFIMVQLPEHASEESETYKMGFNTICEIGKERIRRVGATIKHEWQVGGGFEQLGFDSAHYMDDVMKAGESAVKDLDVGFRVFKLDDSNMNDVYYSAGEYTQDLLSMMESNVKADRTDLDLLFGCLLEWGLPLSMPYQSEKIDGCTVHTYNDGDLIACFDENVPDSVIKEIAKRQPLRAVFRDSSFEGSPAKINVGEIFKMLAPDTRVKVI